MCEVHMTTLAPLQPHIVSTDDGNSDPNVPFIEEDLSNNVIEGAARSKVSRSSATETMGLSAAANLHFISMPMAIFAVVICLLFRLQ